MVAIGVRAVTQIAGRAGERIQDHDIVLARSIIDRLAPIRWDRVAAATRRLRDTGPPDVMAGAVLEAMMGPPGFEPETRRL